ncbi:MAG: LssY C-terminal domain-containing protein [Gammaproteobacteria bacterium]|nr:LssY C-terminal domain-containing protein [Gammaproteobacteria bacterium]
MTDAAILSRSINSAATVLAALVLSACATTVFTPALPDSEGFIARGILQEENSIAVTAAVPSAEEIQALTGIDLYADGIQPVWLRVENRSDRPARVALLSIDENYFSPLEVAWAYRKKFTTDSRGAMERWFLENQLARGVPPGQSRSGFVFTNASSGTKGFNVDVYSDMQSVNFTFFVTMPGFRPDYMDVDFRNLYRETETARVDAPGLRSIIDQAVCCTSDQSGATNGDPLNVVLVGTPEAVRRALLRGGWQETESGSDVTRLARTHHYRGRPPDGTFHWSRPDGSERKELRLWLMPVLVGNETVWLGHVSYDMSGSLFIRNLSDYKIDPDVDDARMFLLQSFWYNQSLRAFAMAGGVASAPIDTPRTNFVGGEYFTDGLRAVLFVSESPVAMDETEIILWEPLGDD